MAKTQKNIMQEVFTQKPSPGEPWDVIIIGSGPSALTAAIYTTRGAASTLIVGGDSWGGQLMLTTTVDNFPGFPEGIQGPELMERIRAQAERFGAEFIERNATSVDFSQIPLKVRVDAEEYLSKSVIIATGAETKWLGVPGEDKLRGRGISSCAPCDAPFFKDKIVAVVGGGDSAMEEALVLTKYAIKVYLLHRRSELRASQAMQEKVKNNEKIEIIWDSEVVEAIGREALEKLKLKTKADSQQGKILAAEGAKKYHGNVLMETEEDLLFWELPVDGMFVAIGHSPSTKIFAGQVDLDPKGYIHPKAGEGGYPKSSTNKKGVFVAGDVHDYYYKQAITAAAFGCMAAMEVLDYLDKPTPTW